MEGGEGECCVARAGGEGEPQEIVKIGAGDGWTLTMLACVRFGLSAMLLRGPRGGRK